jgi:hypothetical protein
MWDSTVNGYGLEDMQQIHLFSKISKQAISPTHSAIPLVTQALLPKVGGHNCHHSLSDLWLTGGHIPPMKNV